ncbi:MAG: hypothetical protein IPO43_15545 [Rhodoferax sp.]|nr:hypothetical protein [Rhodoferax sp.]
MTRQCAACGQVVARRDCHKNRYAEYICHACQATGIRFTPPGRRQYFLKRLRAPVLVGLGVVSVVLLVLWPYLMKSGIFGF